MHKHFYRLNKTLENAKNELIFQCDTCMLVYFVLRWEMWPEPEDRIVNFHIEGYGKVAIAKPAMYTERTFELGVDGAIKQTLELVKPVTQQQRFHPVLGFGGYIG